MIIALHVARSSIQDDLCVLHFPLQSVECFSKVVQVDFHALTWELSREPWSHETVEAKKTARERAIM